MREVFQVVRARQVQQSIETRRQDLLASRIVAGIINYGGMSMPDEPVTAQELMRGESSASMSRERYEENKQRHYDRVRRENAKRQREADPTIET